MLAGSYGNISSTFHQPLKTKIDISNDSCPLTGKNKLATIHSGEILEMSLSFHTELELEPEWFLKPMGMVSIYPASHQNGL